MMIAGKKYDKNDAKADNDDDLAIIDNDPNFHATAGYMANEAATTKAPDVNYDSGDDLAIYDKPADNGGTAGNNDDNTAKKDPSKIKSFVVAMKSKNIKDSSIRNYLLKEGYDISDIETAFSEYNNSTKGNDNNNDNNAVKKQESILVDDQSSGDDSNVYGQN